MDREKSVRKIMYFLWNTQLGIFTILAGKNLFLWKAFLSPHSPPVNRGKQGGEVWRWCAIASLCKNLFFDKVFTSPYPFLAREKSERFHAIPPLYPLLRKEGKKGWFWLRLCCVMVFSLMYTVLAPLASARVLHGGPLQMVSSDSQSTVLELNVRDFQIETAEHEGQTYHMLIIPDMAQTARPGEPQVPTYGTMIGVSSPGGVSLEILDAEYETLSGYHLCPAPGLQVTGENYRSMLPEDIRQVFVLNQIIYSTNALYPDTIVEIGRTGFMRDQAVAQVQFYPVQCNPVTGELRLYRRIVVRITWDSPLSKIASDVQRAGTVYEAMLKSRILNYDMLGRPPVRKEAHGSDAMDIKGMSKGAPPALKIGITEDGIYKLTYGDLTDAGLNLNTVDPHKITIKNQGAEIPVYVQGEDDGVFNAADYILFYGKAITDIYTSKNIYWLTVEGDDGLRMSAGDGTLSGGVPVPAYFPATFHAEVNDHYWQAIPNGKGQDHWFWGEKFSGAQSEDYSLTLNNISTATGTATVRVRLKGITESQLTNPDHHTKIYLNDAEIDDQWWDGQRIFDHVVTVPHANLKEGANAVRVESVGDTGSTVDQIYLNWIEIDYFDTYRAEDDRLVFGAPASGAFQFEVSGFSGSDIEVFNVTDPVNVVRITHATILADGNTYTVKFKGSADAETQYLAQTSQQRRSPVGIGHDEASAWQSASNGADYIIITHEDFYDKSLKLANHRSNSGLRVVTAKVEDIYDEFNYGIFNPQAIRDFLGYAYNNWVAPAPAYVLLIGDACQDFKDYFNTGTINYVPSQIVETDILGETPSDNWFVCVSGDDILPDMFIGRLSAQTGAQVDDSVDKVISYDQKPPKESWNKNVLFVADDDDSAFKDLSEGLAGIVPGDYKVNRVYVDDYTSSGDPTADIKKYINAGSLLVNYAGHGAVDRWGLWNNNTESIFGVSDISTLENTHKLPFVTVADCLNGFFTGVKTRVSMAEEFQRLADKGAIAVWAPTALSYTSGHRLLMDALYESIFQDKQYGLGAATTAAKIATYSQNNFWSELVETFVLFGDPATQLGMSTGSDAAVSLLAPDGGEVIAEGSTFTIQWSAPQGMVKFVLKYSLNNGRTWKKIAKNVEGTSYAWNVPSVKKSKEGCLVEVSGFDESGKIMGKDRSDSTFTIENN